MEKEKDNKSKGASSTSVIDKKHIFLETPAIIQRMIAAVKEGKVFDQPPKMIAYAPISMIKQLRRTGKVSIRMVTGCGSK